MREMIKPSEKWQEVEKKMEELKGLLEENWEKGDWQAVIKGEDTIRTVEKSIASAEEMRQQVNRYLGLNGGGQA